MRWTIEVASSAPSSSDLLPLFPGSRRHHKLLTIGLGGVSSDVRESLSLLSDPQVQLIP